MTVSAYKTVLPAHVTAVWNVVTSVKDYPSWRSDLSRVECLDQKTFLEYTATGFITKFTIQREKPSSLWELTMSSSTISGRWVGRFSQRGAGTIVEFTEYVSVKRFWMRPFIKGYLKKQQVQFGNDLRSALENHPALNKSRL